MSHEARVGIVLVSHSAALAEGTAEVAGQIGGGSVAIAPAGGMDDGGIGTSIARVRQAVRLPVNPRDLQVACLSGSRPRHRSLESDSTCRFDLRLPN